jgi:hypothetical protein
VVALFGLQVNFVTVCLFDPSTDVVFDCVLKAGMHIYSLNSELQRLISETST